MRRKARGSVEQIGERWFLRIPVDEVCPDTGAAVRRRKRVHLGDASEIRSHAAARRAADAWVARRFPEQLATGDSILVAGYAELFLRRKVALYRKSTRRLYTGHIRNHIVARLGSLPLARVGAAQIQDLIAGMVQAGKRRPTIIVMRTVLLQMLRQAEVDGFDVLPLDPRKVRVPKVTEVEREQRYITDDELQRILAAAAPRERALYAVMAYLGLRVSEALALAWAHLDIDSDRPIARIRQSTAGGELFPLKSKTSRADLPMLPELADELRAYRAVWRHNTQGLLFAGRGDGPLHAQDIRERLWLPLLRRLGLPHAGFHAFRHGTPRRWFAAGCSASIVRLLMRHATMAMTERYTHASAEDLRAAVTAASQKNKTPQSPP